MERLQSGSGVLRKLRQVNSLSFQEFVEAALYDPDDGYYARSDSPIGREGDYVTSPALSPVFSFALSRLVQEFLSRAGDDVSAIVDVGCGDGALIGEIHDQTSSIHRSNARFFGVDRRLGRIAPSIREQVEFVGSFDDVPASSSMLVFSNELFHALPFARLVQRGDELHELWVDVNGDELTWSERQAPDEFVAYFRDRRIELEDGQFADVSLDWERLYDSICGRVGRGMIVTFDYGYPASKMFHRRARRFGTAAAYAGHRVSRDLLSNPGQQDLTAHINFTDLSRTGKRNGFETLFFDRQSKFLLALGITDHHLFAPVNNVQIESAAEGVALLEKRDAARQLVLPDGIGHDIRVLAQARGLGSEEWSFQRRLF